ncbi:glutathione S-transferase omega-1-like [Montipora foliosa]|uniref:glutathione S-transferase omega-1-like n=1 Tax=Montipora foliosa TaxID=591990 RepID=UPI0035F1F34A
MTHYSKGSEKPPLKGDVLRLYSMRFCPFAQRARLVLAAKKIPYECVNINLKDKPDWFFDLNPGGKVPVIEQPDGTVIYESAVCCDYFEELFPKGVMLYPKDNLYKKYKQRILVETLGSAIVSAFYKSVLKQEGGQEALNKSLAEFEKYLKQNDKHVGGDEPGMGDYLIWPWFERLQAMQPDTLSQYPATQAWCSAMMELPAVKDCKHSKENHLKFWEKYGAGDPDSQLIGTEKEP